MAVYGEGRGIADEAQPFGLITESVAGIAAIVLIFAGGIPLRRGGAVIGAVGGCGE